MKITDEQVATLPLSAGRAELLEEIMSTPVLDDRPAQVSSATDAPDRRHRWLVPIAAAAAVAMIAAGIAWRLTGTDPTPVQPAPVATSPATGYRAVLDADGWTGASAYEDARYDTGEIAYARGGADVKITWYPASGYADRVEDRRHITDPPSDGTPVDVLGLSSSMWAYSADDHTVIRPVEDGHFLEIRGGGLSEAAFVAMLGQLRLVDEDGFDAALPNGFATRAERSDRISAMLDEIAQFAQPLLPAGVDATTITSQQSDPYQLGAEVTGQIACAWVGQYAEAMRTGDTVAAQEAIDVMSTSRDWPVLHRMNASGDWPEWIWEMSDEMVDGQVPAGWRQSCAD